MTPTVQDVKAKAADRSLLESVSDAVDSALSGFFGNLGESLAIRPWFWIFVSIIICLASCSGFSQFFSENRSEKLWSPQDTQALVDQRKFTSHFDNPFWVEYVIVEDKGGGNVLTKENLINLMELHDEVEDVVSESEVGAEEGAEAGTMQEDTLRTLCYPMPTDNHPCFINSILSLWNFDMATLVADNNVQATIAGFDADANNEGKLDIMLGNLDRTTTPYKADASKITYFLENRQTIVGGKYEDLPAAAWEEQFLIVMADCQEDMVCYRMAGRSFGDEFGGAIKGDVAFLNVAFLIIIVYLCFNLGTCCGGVKSRIALSLVSVTSILMAIGASMGLASLCGQPYTNLHSVYPFVMLGLGVDDSFVIANAFDQTNVEEPLTKRMRDAMSHAGVSITVTSMTDFVAFGISTTTSLPALSSFCFYSSAGILFLFLFQCTMFGAGVVFDARRQVEGKRDKCDCCSVCVCVCVCVWRKPVPITNDDMKQGKVSLFMKESFGPFVTNKTVRLLLLVGNFALLGMGIYGATLLDIKSTTESFIPDGSYILDTFDANDKYFSSDGVSVSIVTEKIDYFAMQSELLDVKNKLNGKAHLVDTMGPTFESWFDNYVAYVGEECLDGFPAAMQCEGIVLEDDGTVTDEDEFYENLVRFLSGPIGSRHGGDVVFVEGSSNEIETAKMKAVFKGDIYNEASLEVEAMQQIRGEIETWEFDSYAYTYNFATWETFVIIEHEMTMNVALCMAAVFFITLILIAHPVTAGLVLVSVGFAIAEILGAMHFVGLHVDTVSVIYLTLAVGLAVDYSAHIGHCFMLKGGDNRSERVIAALEDIGSPVVNGAISTFLAVVVLSASKSYVFRCMFIQFLLTVIFGVLNGIVFLPVLLCYVGPAPYATAPVHGGGEVEFKKVSNKPEYEAPVGSGNETALVARGDGSAGL